VKKKVFRVCSLVLTVLLLAACATPTPQVIRETVIVQGTPEVVEKEVTTVVEVEKVVTATPEPLPPAGSRCRDWPPQNAR
jgi:lipoprotein NlpI